MGTTTLAAQQPAPAVNANNVDPFTGSAANSKVQKFVPVFDPIVMGGIKPAPVFKKLREINGTQEAGLQLAGADVDRMESEMSSGALSQSSVNAFGIAFSWKCNDLFPVLD